MFKNIRKIGSQEYIYIEHSYRIENQVNKISLYIPKNKKLSLNQFLKLNEKNIQEMTKKRLNYIKNNLETSEFYNYAKQLEYIEKTKLLYQIFFKKLDKKEQDQIIDDFLRNFIVNSMEMEGGTISYEIAKAIDNNKKIKITNNINENDIPLYKNLKKAFNKLQQIRLRTPKQIRNLHKIIYKDTFSFAGKFRESRVTFGRGNKLAITSSPEDINKNLKKTIETYSKSKNKIYDFDRIIIFHKNYQQVHPFKDGNSRLGRLIMVNQLFNLNYPPLLVRGTSSERYRTSLVKAINEEHSVPLFKFYYQAYKRTFERFWKPAIEKGINKQFKEYIQEP
jgi:fido (protein-threonine AMPylation protein)